MQALRLGLLALGIGLSSFLPLSAPRAEDVAEPTSRPESPRPESPVVALPALAVQIPGLTVSGVSSGGAMAMQLHVAHSATVGGAALFAAPPYACALVGGRTPESLSTSPPTATLSTALRHCTNISGAPWNPANSLQRLPNLNALLAETRALAAAQAIDPLDGLAGDLVYIFSGQNDPVSPPALVALTRDWYASQVPAEQVISNFTINAGHGMVVRESEVECSETASPYLNGCAVDGAGMALQALYGPLIPRDTQQGTMYAFDQQPFIPQTTLTYTGLHPRGHLFVPKDCEQGGCRLHVAFHGCQQSEDLIGDRFWMQAGYNEWAAANRLVILYPQAMPSHRGLLSPFGLPNPRGCWDWWGYTGQDYLTRDGLQIRAVWSMIQRLGKPLGTPP